MSFCGVTVTANKLANLPSDALSRFTATVLGYRTYSYMQGCPRCRYRGLSRNCAPSGVHARVCPRYLRSDTLSHSACASVLLGAAAARKRAHERSREAASSEAFTGGEAIGSHSCGVSVFFRQPRHGIVSA